MKAQKEVNLLNESVKFTFEITFEEAKQYMKALEKYEIPASLELIPDDILSYLINYKLKKHNEKKK